MKKYNGATFIGLLFKIVFIIMMAIIALRVTPVYLQHYTVVQSLNTLGTVVSTPVSDDFSANNEQLKVAFMKQMEVNNIVDVTMPNITVESIETNEAMPAPRFKISIKYQAIRPLIANISLLFNFEDSHEVTLGQE